MRTITTTAYQFKELSKEAQQTAIINLSDINTNYDWWEFVYEDATEAGIKINEFDLNGGYRTIEGEFTGSGREAADTIVENHGHECNTYKTAKEYADKYCALWVTAQLLGTDEAEDYAIEKAELLDEEFLKDILRCYYKMLEEEYEYRQTDEAIKESIEANEYEFDEDGSQV